VIGRREGKLLLPHFLTEKATRTALQNLYWSIAGSTENARILLEKDPCDINRSLARGNERARHCFLAAASWLSLCRKFAMTEKIFNEQILEPVRCAARFITDIRRLPSSTYVLDGNMYQRIAALKLIKECNEAIFRLLDEGPSMMYVK
jgi:hypothetical protein